MAIVGMELTAEDLPDLLRPHEVAVYAGVSPSTVYRDIQAGRLPTYRSRRPTLVPREAAVAYAAEVKRGWKR